MREVKPCGTEAAYQRHWKRGEPACKACLAAHTQHYMTRKNGPNWQRRPLKPCGTKAAYDRHRYHGEVPCRPCVDAANAERLAGEHRRRERQTT